MPDLCTSIQQASKGHMDVDQVCAIKAPLHISEAARPCSPPGCTSHPRSKQDDQGRSMPCVSPEQWFHDTLEIILMVCANWQCWSGVRISAWMVYSQGSADSPLLCSKNQWDPPQMAQRKEENRKRKGDLSFRSWALQRPTPDPNSNSSMAIHLLILSPWNPSTATAQWSDSSCNSSSDSQYFPR